jgi:hypothetical protein
VATLPGMWPALGSMRVIVCASRLAPGVRVGTPGGCQISYMDHTGSVLGGVRLVTWIIAAVINQTVVLTAK